MKMSRNLGAIASVAVMLSVTACSSSGSKDLSTGNIGNNADMLKQLEAKQAQLSSQEARMKSLEGQLAAAKSSSPKMSYAGGSEMLPPNANPGQCFTRLWVPPTYKTVSEKRLVSEAGERLEVIPAKYGSKTKQILVEEASTKLVTVPATYKTITERVLVQPARQQVSQIAPVYDTVTERVLDKAAHTTWKKGSGPIQRIDSSTGEIMCLVEIPATYKTITKRVLKTPASTRTNDIPAVYKTVQKRVVATQASTRTIEIPAKYATVSVTEEIQPASTRAIAIPAKYSSFTRQEVVSEGQMDWREILCDTNTTPARISEIQRALQQAGFNPGSVDGQIGAGTIRAVNAFQRSKGLPVDKYLNVATVRALGVSVK